MQSVSSRIWTRVAVSISYDDNHYTTSTSNLGNLMLTNLVTILNAMLFGGNHYIYIYIYIYKKKKKERLSPFIA